MIHAIHYKLAVSGFLLVILQVSSFGQCSTTPTIDCHNSCDAVHDFGVDCPSCIQLPCCLNPTVNGSVLGVNYHWVSVFDDDFSGGLDTNNKWLTPFKTGVHCDALHLNYDNDKNFVLDHPGIELIDSAVRPFNAYRVDYDHSTLQSWSYTSSTLHTQYQFPSFNNRFEPSYGIYQITCSLPTVQIYNGGPTTEPPYGDAGNLPQIGPAFWMWGVDDFDNYGEIDGYEFEHTSNEMMQTSHYPIQPLGCSSFYSCNNYVDGQFHNFYIIYTPDEIDWYTDGTCTKSITRFYGEDFHLFSHDLYFPLYSTTNNSDIDDLYSNCIFPQRVPMWLILNDWVNNNALNQYFPVSLKVQSVHYWFGEL